jgi:hypothetical protein
LITIRIHLKFKEMKARHLNIPLNAVLVQDPKIGGFTAYFKQFPDIIAEGDTDDEAMKNLTDAVYDVFMFKGKLTETETDKNYKIIDKTASFMF